MNPDELPMPVRKAMEEIRAQLDVINQTLYPEEGSILVDGVIVIGRRSFGIGVKSHLNVYPINEDQPSYVTQGLLYSATDLVAEDDVEQD